MTRHACGLGLTEAHYRTALEGLVRLDAAVVEALATRAYERAGFAHTFAHELPSPVALVTRLGAHTRYRAPSEGEQVERVGRAICFPVTLTAAHVGLAVAHEAAHLVLEREGIEHAHGDVVALTLALLAPRATVVAAREAGEELAVYQRAAPPWVLALRAERVERVGCGGIPTDWS